MSEYIRKVKDGKITVETPLFDEGTELIIEIDKLPKMRTLRANRRYFAAVVNAICKKTGHTKSDVHEYLKLTINPKKFPDLKTGEVKIIGGSTRDMTSAEFLSFTNEAERISEFVGAEIGTEDQYWSALLDEAKRSENRTNEV